MEIRKKEKKSKRSKGRPRLFMAEKALDAAMQIFWHKGYDGASMPDLERAMGIKRSSMYSTFGSKEKLFHQVIERYAGQVGGVMGKILAEPNIRTVIEGLLKLSACGVSAKTRGCLLVQGAMACADASERIQQEVIQKRCMMELALRSRIEQAMAASEISSNVNAPALAKFVAIVQQGLAVQNAGGAKKEELLAAVSTAMQAVDVELKGMYRDGKFMTDVRRY